jgi:hypothetical protein
MSDPQLSRTLPETPQARRIAVVAGAVLVAVAVNLAIYGLGRAAGGSFEFTSASDRPAEVDAVTVAGFSAVPLLVGLTLVALLMRFGSWVTRAALVVAPVLAVGTILLMTLPADFDTTSTVTLALCHLALIPIVVGAIRILSRTPQPTPAS